MLDVILQRGDQFLENRSAPFVGLQCLQVFDVALAQVAQLLLEAGYGVRVRGETRFEVALAGGQINLEIPPNARELGLQLFVALEELSVSLGIACLTRGFRRLPASLSNKPMAEARGQKSEVRSQLQFLTSDF